MNGGGIERFLNLQIQTKICFPSLSELGNSTRVFALALAVQFRDLRPVLQQARTTHPQPYLILSPERPAARVPSPGAIEQLRLLRALVERVVARFVQSMDLTALVWQGSAYQSLSRSG